MFIPSSLRLTTTRIHHHLRRTPFLASVRHPTAALHQPFHNAARLAYPRKGSEDKDSINRESMEYTKTGSDDQAAAMGDAAFNPDKTSPEEQMKTAGEGQGDESNPLDVSPANTEVSKPRDGEEGGAGGSSSSAGSSQSDRKRSSGKGASAKSGRT